MRIAFASVCLSALLLSCSPARPEPSICDLAKFPADWAGSDVRVQGLALGASPHGFVLVSKACNRAISLEMIDKSLFSKLDEANMRGLVSLDVSGKFFARDNQATSANSRLKGSLLVKTVYSFRLAPLAERARANYWETRLRRRDTMLGQ